MAGESSPLSPNNRKIGADKAINPEDEGGAEKKLGRDVLLGPRMLEAMGRGLAALHLGTGDVGGAVREDLAARGGAWLAAAASVLGQEQVAHAALPRVAAARLERGPRDAAEDRRLVDRGGLWRGRRGSRRHRPDDAGHPGQQPA